MLTRLDVGRNSRLCAGQSCCRRQGSWGRFPTCGHVTGPVHALHSKLSGGGVAVFGAHHVPRRAGTLPRFARYCLLLALTLSAGSLVLRGLLPCLLWGQKPSRLLSSRLCSCHVCARSLVGTAQGAPRKCSACLSPCCDNAPAVGSQNNVDDIYKRFTDYKARLACIVGASIANLTNQSYSTRCLFLVLSC